MKTDVFAGKHIDEPRFCRVQRCAALDCSACRFSFVRAVQSCKLSEIHGMAMKEREEAHRLEKLKRK